MFSAKNGARCRSEQTSKGFYCILRRAQLIFHQKVFDEYFYYLAQIPNLHRSDLAGAQSEARQEKEDCVVASAAGSCLVTRGEKLLHILRPKGTVALRHRPTEGIANAKSTAVSPRRNRNRKNDRKAVARSCAVVGLNIRMPLRM